MKKVCVLILMGLVFFGYDQENEGKNNCSIPATIRDAGTCGFVVELEDGTRLEPVIVVHCGLYSDYKEGRKVFISYEQLKDVVHCTDLTAVKITCLRFADPTSEE